MFSFDVLGSSYDHMDTILIVKLHKQFYFGLTNSTVGITLRQFQTVK